MHAVHQIRGFHQSFDELWEEAWEITAEFIAGDGTLHQELRVNGLVLDNTLKKALRTFAAAWIAFKLQDGVPVSIGYASEPFDRVFVGAEVAA